MIKNQKELERLGRRYEKVIEKLEQLNEKVFMLEKEMVILDNKLKEEYENGRCNKTKTQISRQ